MPRIVSILRAAHCRSTHHYFALDALGLIDTVPGERLARMLLRYYSHYLAGAKAPDAKFRDFQNHVVHVGDGNWGGAPQACEKWLKQAIEHLDRRQWKQAAYACGVLSHYFTDPLMPLHTSQSERESVVHRPLEWSIFKAYDAIVRTMAERKLQAKLEYSHGPNWISKAVVASAHVAHQHYESLLDLYDLTKGVRNPAAGLNAQARVILAELFSIVHTGWARVLCRIADETTAEIPNCSLTFATLFATIDIPYSTVVKKLSNGAERRAVTALIEEFTRTGKVRNNLPLEIQSVQAHRSRSLDNASNLISEQLSVANPVPEKSVNAFAPTARDDRRTRRLDSLAIAPDTLVQLNAMAGSTVVASSSSSVSNESRDALGDKVEATGRQAASAPREQDESNAQLESNADVALERLEVVADDKPDHTDMSDVNTVDVDTVDVNTSDPVVLPIQNKSAAVSARSGKWVDGYSLLVDAPSIGPKTAKRFEKIGLLTMGDFLMADPAVMQEQLDTRWITVELLEEWQAQARLVCEIPGLYGYEAQLLVAVNCRASADLAARDPRGLYARISAIVPTTEGARILRNSKVPQFDDVVAWIDAAQHARPFNQRRRAG